jgi:DNA-binding protein H-NS
VPAKYRSAETGETWTGRGRAPLWLAGKNKDDFLIK